MRLNGCIIVPVFWTKSQMKCTIHGTEREKYMKNSETRFLDRKAHLIDFNSFTEVMKELLDDNSLEIENEYPVLSMYSRGHDCGYDVDELMERIEDYLGITIAACFKYTDLEVIYLIEDK